MDSQLNFHEGRVSSRRIAEAFERRHDQIIKIINKYRKAFEPGEEKVLEAKVETGGRPTTEYLLTEEQFLFLLMLMGNSRNIVDFKVKFIKQLSKMKQKLLKNN